MLGYVFFKDQKNAVSATQGDEIKGAFSIGMILGQLAFGTLGDALGRHVVYGKECMFAIFGTLMVVLLPWNGLSYQEIVAWIAVFRVITGMGAGGGTFTIHDLIKSPRCN
jgi:MFS transporter, PHS family, inorganic phosphate transporter